MDTASPDSPATPAPKRTRAAAAPKPASPTVPRIVKRAPPRTPKPGEDPLPISAAERALAGVYRVIHGSIAIPVPLSERLKADGTEDGNKPTQELAHPGDEVYLGDQDAASMLDADIIEPLDAKPSRVGKVWEPPKPVRNKN
jgi:hypothetical protein